MIYVITPFEHTFKAWCDIHAINHRKEEMIKISKKEDLLGRTIKEEDAIILLAINGFRPGEYSSIHSELYIRQSR